MLGLLFQVLQLFLGSQGQFSRFVTSEPVLTPASGIDKQWGRDGEETLPTPTLPHAARGQMDDGDSSTLLITSGQAHPQLC